MKTLNVQKITRSELLKKWSIVGKFLPHGELFIRSNKKGEINFNVAPVYTWSEIELEQAKGRPVHFTLPPDMDSI